MKKQLLVSLIFSFVSFLLGITIGNWYPSEKLWNALQYHAATPEDENSSLAASLASPAATPTFANSAELELKEIRFVCDDDLIRPFWIDLLREPAFTARLLLGPLENKYDCSEVLTLKEVDLNDDGRNEYAIDIGSLSLCGIRNCPFAVYGVFSDDRSFMKTTAGTFDFSRRKLLYSEGNFDIEIQESKKNGYRDLLLRFNGGNYDNFLRLYEFDGSTYQVGRCYDETKPSLKRVKAKCD